MNLYTLVDVVGNFPKISHRDKLMLMGSCFAENMGQYFTQFKMNCDVNPYGILYNPLSIEKALREIIAGKEYQPDDLFCFEDYWYSFMHHGSFASSSVSETLSNINERIRQAHQRVKQLDYLLITFGSAWVYELGSTGEVVSNCHKQPEKSFRHRMIGVEEIVAKYTHLISEWLAVNPTLRFIFTVSPIRYIKEGMHANQLSKSVLLLSIDQLQEKFKENLSYFPSYEIVVDELRDYRFYAEDMVHPTSVATKYVWNRFAESCFDDETAKLNMKIADIHKMLAHHPLHPQSRSFKFFLEQILLKIDQVSTIYPYLDFKKEKQECLTKLSLFHN